MGNSSVTGNNSITSLQHFGQPVWVKSNNSAGECSTARPQTEQCNRLITFGWACARGGVIVLVREG
jgi:hypothetical protein